MVIGTPKVYKVTIPNKILNYLKVVDHPRTPKIIARELNLKVGTVNTNLQRLKESGNVRNSQHGLWEPVTQFVQEDEKISTDSTWGGTNLYKLQNDTKALLQFLLSYDEFHGIEIHLETIGSNITFDEIIDDRNFTLEKRKFRIRCSNNPIPFAEAQKLLGLLSRIFEKELNYYGSTWLIHIEFNIDREGYKINGVQRIEVKSILNNIYRIYNKKIRSKDFLRSEAILNHATKTISIAGGLQVISGARDIEDAFTNVHDQVRQSKKLHSELAHSRQMFKKEMANSHLKFEKKVDKTLGVFQAQIYDVNIGMSAVQLQLQSVEEKLVVDQETNTAILQELQKQTPLSKTIIQQNELQLDQVTETKEFIRQLVEKSELSTTIQIEDPVDREVEMVKGTSQYEEFKQEIKKTSYFEVLKEIVRIIKHKSGISRSQIRKQLSIKCNKQNFLWIIKYLIESDKVITIPDPKHRQKQILYYNSKDC